MTLQIVKWAGSLFLVSAGMLSGVAPVAAQPRAAAVLVTNDATQPVPTIVAGQEPFTKLVGGSLLGFEASPLPIKLIDVPADKRLVIEHVSCQTIVWTGESTYAS